MDIQHIKQIPSTDYLQQQCYTPTRVQGIHYWYCSPLRNEGPPSFKVNTERNQWYDFGTGEHGDIIDLVCALQHCTISKAIELLGDIKQVAHRDFSFGGESKASEHKLVILSAQPLNNPHSIHYIAERGIPISIANRFCSEIRYNNTNRTYYAMDLQTMLVVGKFVVLISKAALLQKRSQLLVKAQTFYKSLKGLWISFRGKR